MPFNEKNGLKYFQFNNLADEGILHGIFCRHGGVSPAPWQSLNLGGSLGDSRENIIENRRRIFSIFNFPIESLFDVWQVHGADVICTTAPRPLDAPHQKADAILTDEMTITLFMRFADCVPILLFDPVKQVVGLVHAGWQGTVKKIVTAAIRTMEKQYACDTTDIICGIGPSIGPDHYEIGSDVAKQVQNVFSDRSEELLIKRDRKTYLDLWAANRIQLEELRVKSIEVSGICTACHIDDWYSHRQEHGRTGRFGAIISLRKGY